MDDREKAEMKRMLGRKADLFKAISHPVRLCILALLMQNERSNVTDMQCCIDVSQSTVSQHIAKLKAAGVIFGEREGTEIYYHIGSREIRQVMELVMGQNGLCKGE